MSKIHVEYSQTVFISCVTLTIALKVSFSGRKIIFLLKKSVQISPCSFVCEGGKVNVSEFQV